MLTLKPANQPSVKIDNKADQEYVVSMLEQAISLTNNHKLKEAMTTLRNAKPLVAEVVSTWLSEADKRIQLEETLVRFNDSMNAHTTKNGA
jgi:hypothetical protein